MSTFSFNEMALIKSLEPTDFKSGSELSRYINGFKEDNPGNTHCPANGGGWPQGLPMTAQSPLVVRDSRKAESDFNYCPCFFSTEVSDDLPSTASPIFKFDRKTAATWSSSQSSLPVVKPYALTCSLRCPYSTSAIRPLTIPR